MTKKHYLEMTDEEYKAWYELYVENEYHPEEEEAEHCLCRGAGACIQCNPKMFL